MGGIVYSILLDFGNFGNFFENAIFSNLPWVLSMIGIKIGLALLRDSAT